MLKLDLTNAQVEIEMGQLLDFKRDTRISPDHRALLRKHVAQVGQEIVDLAHELGLKVFGEDLPPEVDGILEYRPSAKSSSGFVVVVNAAHPPARQRFSAAHEIGHFVLHRGHHKAHLHTDDENVVTLPREFKRSTSVLSYLEKASFEHDIEEREANSFACELLMPRHLFSKSAHFLTGDVSRLADEFMVSRGAAEIRLGELMPHYLDQLPCPLPGRGICNPGWVRSPLTRIRPQAEQDGQSKIRA